MNVKRNQIVEAAHRLFLERGYGATSMDLIAAEANVSKRTVYSHFDTKEVLFASVIKAFCEHMIASINDPPTGLPVEEHLCKVGEELITLILNPEAGAMLHMVIAEAEHFPELARTFWEAGPLPHMDRIAQLLENSPEISVGDPQLAARQFAGMIKGPYFLANLLGVEDKPDPERLRADVRIAVSRFLAATRT